MGQSPRPKAEAIILGTEAETLKPHTSLQQAAEPPSRVVEQPAATRDADAGGDAKLLAAQRRLMLAHALLDGPASPGPLHPGPLNGMISDILTKVVRHHDACMVPNFVAETGLTVSISPGTMVADVVAQNGSYRCQQTLSCHCCTCRLAKLDLEPMREGRHYQEFLFETAAVHGTKIGVCMTSLTPLECSCYADRAWLLDLTGETWSEWPDSADILTGEQVRVVVMLDCEAGKLGAWVDGTWCGWSLVWRIGEHARPRLSEAVNTGSAVGGVTWCVTLHEDQQRVRALGQPAVLPELPSHEEPDGT
jgi:hypothetical protein